MEPGAELMRGASETEAGPHPDVALRGRPTSPVLRSGEVADGELRDEWLGPDLDLNNQYDGIFSKIHYGGWGVTYILEFCASSLIRGLLATC
ncbi:hypothetical protein Rcae01_03986 [Novipirellula caenicola]|uniref:Uncharacterized protein n=1 Tax=Novipirellula caenicola TaxID=1536901 RepID=A0ABP9VW79_9BACT